MGLGSILVVTDYENSQNHTVFMFDNGMARGDYWTRRWQIYTEHQHRLAITGIGKGQIFYCLSLHVPGRCRIKVHTWFLSVVVVWNALKVVCMVLTLRQKREPLTTLGDAVVSFLQRPCSSSERLCLLSEDEIKTILKARKEGDLQGSRPKRWQPERFWYYQGVKFHRWLVYTTL